MRFSHSLLLASVAILTLPSCSSAKGPGEIGTKNDIVVRNHGDAPPPPSETMLQQEAATPPEMMAARTLQGDVPQIDDSEARALAAQHEAEVSAQAPQADAVQAQMQAQQEAQIAQERLAQQEQLAAEGQAQAMAEGQPIPRAPEPTQMQRQAMQAQQQVAQQGGMEAVPPPVVNQAPTLAEQATQTMPVQDQTQAAVDSTRAGVANYAGTSPEVDAGLDQRTPAPPMGSETAEVVSAPVAQAATEYQAQPVEQAAQQALQNPPVSVVNAQQQQQAQPQAHTQTQAAAQAAAPAAPVSAPQATTRTSLVPTPADIAAGGMRVVRSDDGMMVAKPAAPTPTSPQAQTPTASAPTQAATPTAQAPVSATTQGGTPVMDRAMISRAQTALTEKGFYTGPVDGEMSTATLNALSRYQSANFLTPGGMTVETAQHLGLIQ